MSRRLAQHEGFYLSHAVKTVEQLINEMTLPLVSHSLKLEPERSVLILFVEPVGLEELFEYLS